MIRNIRGIGKHVFAALLFCLVMSMTMVCFADEKGTVAVESAKIREKADASSNQLGSVAKGGTVDIIGETTGADGKKWYQVYVDANTKGFIRADLINRSGSGSLPAVDGSASASTGTAAETGTSANVTPTEARAATVVKSGVRVRKSASTSSAEVATVSRGIVVAVTGETTGTDGQKWYQVTFKHSDKDINGFIRSDLITFDNVPDDPAIAEITGQNAEGQTEPQETEPQETEQPRQEDNSNADEYAGIIYLNVDEEPYIMPGFELVSLDWNNQKIKAYRNGTFFIVYAQKQNGEEGWYLLDKDKGAYMRYPYTMENVTVPNASALSGNLVPIAAMGAVILILVIVVLILFVKLRGNGGYYEDYDEDDDYPDDDIEDIDDLEDEEPAPQPMRRSMPPKQPPRRPAPSQGSGQPRRPAPQGQNGAPQGQSGQPRRPASQGQNEQPPRRPVPSQGSGQPPRRPAPSQGNGQPQGQRRPSNRPPQNAPQQRGQKAKSMLADDDDDMDFIDID